MSRPKVKEPIPKEPTRKKSKSSPAQQVKKQGRRIQSKRQISGGFLGNLSVGQKLALAGLLATIPFVGALGSLISQSNAETRHLLIQQKGQQMLANLNETLLNTQYVRLQSVRAIAGEPGATQLLDESRQKLNNALKALNEQAKAAGYQEIVDQITEASQSLETLNWSVDSGSMHSEEATANYTDFLLTLVLPLYYQVAHAADMKLTNNLILSEMAEVGFDVLPQKLPIIGRVISVTLALTENIKEGQPIPPDIREAVKQTWNDSRNAFDEVDNGLQLISSVSPMVKEIISPDTIKFSSSINKILETIDAGVLTTGRLAIKTSELSVQGAEAATQLTNLFNKTNNVYGILLDQEVARQRRNATLLILSALLLTALVAVLLYVISRAITRPLDQLAAASQRLSRGDLDVSAPVTTRDELGTLAVSFNNAVQQLRENARRNEEERLAAQKLQQNVEEFLNVTMDIAEGDLTKRGIVTEDVLGNVVDSINLMTEELAEILRDVQSASQSVTNGSQTMLASTAEIAQGATTTAEQTHRVAERTKDINRQIQETAQIAQASADAAFQALQASQQGRDAVNTTLAGMNTIRESTMSVTERVESLAKRSEQIQEILDSISHIASQTNLLSLHASIEAAGAGEAGKRFTVVAEEVRQLADESSVATGRIAQLVAGIQNEIREVATSMRESAEQVQAGYTVAGRAGEQLEQIGRLSEESARLARQISQATAEQVRGVESVGQGVQEIAQIAQESQVSVQQGRSAAQKLLKLAQQLSGSLQRFKLPS